MDANGCERWNDKAAISLILCVGRRVQISLRYACRPWPLNHDGGGMYFGERGHRFRSYVISGSNDDDRLFDPSRIQQPALLSLKFLTIAEHGSSL